MLLSLPRLCKAIALPLLYWIAIALSADRAVAGSDPLKSIGALPQRVWRSEDGLPQNTVPAIVQASDGYLWFGTELGLVRFDGQRFTVFDRSNTPELKSNLVDALVEDRAKNLWIGTNGGGLTRLSKGVFQTFTTKDGLSSDAVRCLLEDKAGNLWIGTDGGGADRFSNGRFTAYKVDDGLAGSEVFALAESTDGGMWIGTHSGLSRLAHGVFRNFGRADGLANNYVRALYASPGNVVWVGTNGGGLARFEGAGFKTFTTADGLTSNIISSIRGDLNGSLWVGTIGGGINRLAGGKFSAYREKDGFASDDVWSIWQDRDENVWIGTGGGGISRLQENALFESTGVRDGLSGAMALPVMEDHQGVIWIGTNGAGVNRMENGRITWLTTKDGLADNRVLSLSEGSDGAMWMGTGKGLNRLKDGKITTYRERDGLPADIVSSALADKEGNLWFGTRAGLARYKDGQFTTYTTKQGMSANVIRCIYEDHEHRLWIGTGGGGLNLFQDGRFQVFDSRKGLSNNLVFAIREDRDGVLWVGTNGGGLNRFQDGKFSVITAQNGLLDDAIFRILDDGAGNLWMSSNRGVFRVGLDSLNAFAAHKADKVGIVAYGKADGMATAECNGGFQPAGWKARDGRLWFPTMQGVVSVDPKTVRSRGPQPIVIERVLVDRRVVGSSGEVRVPTGKGELEFQYTAPNLSDAAKLNFRYRLEGFDRDWVDAGTRRTAYYTNIPASSYRFVVEASDGDGNWTPESAGFNLQLTPHFYETPMFVALLTGVLLACAFAIHRGHLRGLRMRERILERHVSQRTAELRVEIAERQKAEEEMLRAKEAAERASRVKSEFLANMSHEIRTPMNGILGMTELALTTTVIEEQHSYLEIVKTSADHLLAVINDILDFSKIESGKCDLELLDFDLRDSLQETVRSIAFRADQGNVRVVCDVTPDVPQFIHADPVRIRQVLLNLLGNACKFTKAGEVVLQVSCDEGERGTQALHFVVSDSGIGIAQDKQESIFEAFSQGDTSITRRYGGTGLGLAICSRLVKLMGGNIWVESELGHGSRFHFTVKWGEPRHEHLSGAPRATPEGRDIRPSLAALAGHLGEILIVEDNSASRLLARVTLERAGFKVREASNGVQALNAVRFGNFSVVFMDCRMPVMDGYMAAQRIRQLPGKASEVPIIALTASAFREDRERTEEAGMDDFLSKPFHPHELVAKCEAWARAGKRSEAQRAGDRERKYLDKPGEDLSPEFLASLLQMFLSSAPQTFARMLESIECQNWTEVKHCSHWLQGGAARVLDPALQAGLEKIEKACNYADPSIDRSDIDLLQQQFDGARRTANTWLREKAHSVTA